MFRIAIVRTHFSFIQFRQSMGLKVSLNLGPLFDVKRIYISLTSASFPPSGSLAQTFALYPCSLTLVILNTLPSLSIKHSPTLCLLLHPIRLNNSRLNTNVVAKNILNIFFILSPLSPRHPRVASTRKCNIHL